MIKRSLLITLLFFFLIIGSRKTVKAEIKNKIANTARSINVKILSPYSDASGVLVKKDSNEYTVLTAWHALEGVQIGDEMDIETNDGVIHPVSLDSIKKLKMLTSEY